MQLPIYVKLAAVALISCSGFFLKWLGGPKAVRLVGKHVLITGGSSGIGEAIAIKCVSLGAKVTLLARKLPDLEAAKERVLVAVKKSRPTGMDASAAEYFTETQVMGSVEVVSGDTTDPEGLSAAVAKAEEKHGQVDMVVCSAGIALPKKFEDTTPAEFENVLRVNTLGTVNTVRACYSSVTRKPGGRIVLVSSQAGQVGIFGYTAYSASKFALQGFGQALQMEVKSKGTAVTLAYPPDTDTPQNQWENSVMPPETKIISDSSPFKPSHVAKDIVGAMRRGHFHAYTGVDGFMLKTLTAGMSPQPVPYEAVVEMTLMPLFRLVSLVYLKMWAFQISSFQKKQNSVKDKAQ